MAGRHRAAEAERAGRRCARYRRPRPRRPRLAVHGSCRQAEARAVRHRDAPRTVRFRRRSRHRSKPLAHQPRRIEQKPFRRAPECEDMFCDSPIARRCPLRPAAPSASPAGWRDRRPAPAVAPTARRDRMADAGASVPPEMSQARVSRRARRRKRRTATRAWSIPVANGFPPAQASRPPETRHGCAPTGTMPSGVVSNVTAATCKAGLIARRSNSSGAGERSRKRSSNERRPSGSDARSRRRSGWRKSRPPPAWQGLHDQCRRCVAHVISALVPIRASAATQSARRHSSGIGAAIIPARMMPRSERMLSQVWGIAWRQPSPSAIPIRAAARRWRTRC